MRAALAVLVAAATSLVAATTGPGASGTSPCAPPLIAVGAIGEGAKSPELMPPTVGRLRILALFVDFLDAPGRSKPELYADAAFPALQTGIGRFPTDACGSSPSSSRTG